MTTRTDVIVIGGGYAGVLAANRLTERDDIRITLVNPRPTFVDRIRLHQLVGGSDDAVVDYGEVLADRVRLVVDTATRIDGPRRTVELASGGTLGYDHLVYAVGSHATEPTMPGAAFAYPIATLEAARRLRQVLDDTPSGAPVTVVGGGPTGIETAAELAELGRRVTLVCGRTLGPYLHPRGRRSVARRLARLGVRVLDGPGARVTAVARDAVQLEDGRGLASAVTIWAAGFGVPDLATRSGLATDAEGRLVTDETLTSVDDERIVAAGDSASPSGLPYRMSCQAAVQLGPSAAGTVLSRIAGEQPRQVALAMVSQCISMGRHDGIYQLARPDDTAVGFHVAGRPGAAIKEFICSGIIWALGHEARRPGSVDYPGWTKDRRRARLLADVDATAFATSGARDG
nr:FAD-dependent oxidoreductase [Propionicimonas sp.]